MECGGGATGPQAAVAVCEEKPGQATLSASASLPAESRHGGLALELGSVVAGDRGEPGSARPICGLEAPKRPRLRTEAQGE